MASLKVIFVVAFFILEVIASAPSAKIDPIRLILVAGGLACLAASMLF